MDKEFEIFNKDIIYTIENHSLNRYEMVLNINTLLQSFIKRNRVGCLTSMRNDVIYLKFIVSDDTKRNMEFDIKSILRKNKIKKLKGI